MTWRVRYIGEIRADSIKNKYCIPTDNNVKVV